MNMNTKAITTPRTVSVANFKISNNLPITVIAGPCQLESIDHALFMSDKLKQSSERLGVKFIYKTSFDKANRSSIKGARGVGLEAALKVFEKIKKEINCPILTDIHTEEQCPIVAEYVDVLQIPAFLCRQTDLLLAAAKNWQGCQCEERTILNSMGYV